jgi:LysM repeat protein
MWNSSRRIALFSTSLVLLGAGLFGAAWFAHWLPIEVGEAETGDLATRQTLEELDALNWSSFTNRDDIAEDSAASPFVHSQHEPDVSEAAFADTNEFVDRKRWLNRDSESNAVSRSSRSGEALASHNIPDEFPASDFSHDRRQNSAGTSANRPLSNANLDQYDSQRRGVQQASGIISSEFGASASGRLVQSIQPDESRSAPPNLFDTEESPTFGEARGFTTEVAFAERAATLDLFEPEEAESSDEAPPFDGGSTSQSGQTTADPIRTAARETTPDSLLSPDKGPQAKLQQIDELLGDQNFVAAHRELSTLYWNNPELKSTIMERLDKNAQTIYFTPQPHFLEPYEVQSGDFLQRVAPKYAINWEYLAALNRVDPRKVRAGQKLKVIKGPFSAFVDLSDFELTVHCHGFFVKRYSIGTGRDSSTPVGKFAVLDRITAPQYTDPNGKVIEGGHSTNPLGTHWIDLGDSYGIHGTIEPSSIGRAESAGCVRMRNEDVVEVYNFLVKGSEVVIRP